MRPNFLTDGLSTRISLFFAALFIAYGVIVPYFPVWLHARELTPVEISIITASPLFLRVIVHAVCRLARRPGRQLPPRHRDARLECAGAGSRAERAVGVLADPRRRRGVPPVHRHHAAADRDGGGDGRAHRRPRLRTHAAVGLDHLHRRELRRRRPHRGAGRRLRHLADRVLGRHRRLRRAPAARAGARAPRAKPARRRTGACRFPCGS